MQLTHLNTRGEANMVDVGDKHETRREAVASGRILMQPETLKLLSDGELPKGDVIATARIAGIQAAKRTHELIPLCHSLALSKVSIEFDIDPAQGCVHVTALCRLNGRTGVEMEALTAVSVACLTLYDMCKAVDKDMCIDAVQLESKRGGVRGDYQRSARPQAPIVTGEGTAGEVTLGERCASPCVRVKFLAELRERVGVSDTVLDLDQVPSRDIAGLKAALSQRDTRFSVLTDQRTLCAINQVMANDSARITDEDEVAFFPPVTGG
ncbi:MULTISPECIES: cyclic pyranopterin monophosphate synthase MoaC [Halomonas]|uniref:Cyclic pyranopterin monophosphate synthase n=1 Tax=Halomonas citrativorans TaxID=2742612 RepID=A0ABR9FE66_9GAMM|nr:MULTISPECIES: cyclic pyranopterin monophosphate synthase MoaC [Halomonas]MBE0404788.1 cyclic pyranopterin monophosphate synthase MoaC [Halomonas citrativorans]HCR97280.1 cyclic pyranopterin monophosphate synthase MoaC [Halomonas sp.]